MAISSQGYMKRAIPTSGKREMTMVEFKQWMKKFDTDGDGRISKEELRQALRSVGGWFTGWNSGRGVRSADGNGNGFIDDEEIQNLVSFAEKKLGVKIGMAIRNHGYVERVIPTSGKREMTMEEFEQWLKKFGTDGDGCISKEELRQALRSVGGWFTWWNGGRGVRFADANGNGFIDDEEIQNLASFAEKNLSVKILLC